MFVTRHIGTRSWLPGRFMGPSGLLAATVVAMLLAGHTSAPAQQAALFDELTPLCPDSKPVNGAASLSLDTPRGVLAGIHVLVAGLPSDAEVRCTLRHDGTEIGDVRFYRLIDVPVEQNTGLSSRTEAWDGKTNPHVIRKAPFRIFEVLEPLQSAARAADDGVLALRVELPIAPDAPTGTSSYELHLKAGEWQQTLCWVLTTHAAVVPAPGPESPGYTNWFSLGNIARRHDVKLWSEPFWNMLGQYADLMARGRQNTFIVRWRDFCDRDAEGEIRFDLERLKRYVQLFLNRGFTILEGGHLAHRHKGDWSSARLDFFLTGQDVTSPEGAAELTAFLAALREALDKLQLPAHVRYAQHLSDEPTNRNAAAYQHLARLVRAGLPDVQIFEATMSRELAGAVDWWCPQIQVYQKHRDFFEERKQAGGEVWVYTCLVPGGPWLNRLLDQERVRPVYLGWALAKYDLAGFLHWGLNHYRSKVDPFEQSVVPHGNGPPNFLPAGDSHVVYPGKAGPLSGVRFEAHRIGLEDAELLQMLKVRDPARAAKLIDRVFRAFDDYDRDVALYRSARRALLVVVSEVPVGAN